MRVSGPVSRLSLKTNLALDGSIITDKPIRWSDHAEMPEASLFVADLGRSLVSSCFIPIQIETGELFLDQTYENVRDFHNIYPQISQDGQTYFLDCPNYSTEHGTVVLIGGSPENNWYHWLMNWLPRLALVASMHPHLLTDVDVKFCFHINARSEPYRPLIDLFGLDESRLVFVDPNDGLLVERLYVPVFGNPNLYYSELLKRTRDFVLGNELLKQEAHAKPRRVYISREQIAQPKRRIRNLPSLYGLLKQCDIESATLEQLSALEQVKLFSQCQLVVGVHGAGLANLVFAPPSTAVVIMDVERNISLGLSGMFTGLCQALDLKWKLISVEEEILDHVDYSQFYNLHNRDVIIDAASLGDAVMQIDAENPSNETTPSMRTKLDQFIVETNNLLAPVKPFEGFAPIGYEVDYLGVELGLHLIKHWYPPSMYADAMDHARHRRTTLPTPAVGEPFFETGSILRAIRDGGDTINLIELGGGYGARACELALHCRRLGKKVRSLVVEPISQYVQWGEEHFRHNSLSLEETNFVQCAVDADARPVPMRTAYQGFGNEVLRADTIQDGTETISLTSLLEREPITLRDGSVVEMVNALPLSSLLAPFDIVDLVDIDVQHLEHAILTSSWKTVNLRVKRLHIGTHSSALQDAVREELTEHGWVIEVDLLPFTETTCLMGPTKINDGILAAYNPRFC